MIGLKISRNFLSQSEVKPQPVTYSFIHVFPRFVSATCVCFECFDWFTGLSVSFVISQSDYLLVLVFRHSIENFSNWLLNATEIKVHLATRVPTIVSCRDFIFTFFISDLSSGSFQDYVYGSLQVKYAFAVEPRDEGHFGFLLPPFLIEPTARELFEGLKAMVR